MAPCYTLLTALAVACGGTPPDEVSPAGAGGAASGTGGVAAPAITVPFEVGGGPATTTAPDAAFFTGMVLSYQ